MKTIYKVGATVKESGDNPKYITYVDSSNDGGTTWFNSGEAGVDSNKRTSIQKAAAIVERKSNVMRH